MKKIMMMLAMVFTLSTTFAFTGEEAVNKQALKAFKTDFAGATDAAWIVTNDYYRVAFTMNEQKLFAFYDGNGEFMAVTRYISSFQLPLNLQGSLKKSYSNYWISDLFEIASKDEVSYYVTLENADTKIVLKSTDGSDWSVFKKSRKA
ncbi:MAG TPA: hypothetical protein VGQ09_06945 [Chitinophagaceae bacterium]|jgi:hypothetical protein|nr:hypothetical protein [Chitinophagaceae bacterium]